MGNGYYFVSAGKDDRMFAHNGTAANGVHTDFILFAFLAALVTVVYQLFFVVCSLP